MGESLEGYAPNCEQWLSPGGGVGVGLTTFYFLQYSSVLSEFLQ